MEIIFTELKYTGSGTMSALESSIWKLRCLNNQLNAWQSFLYPPEGAYHTQCGYHLWNNTNWSEVNLVVILSF